MNQSAYDLLVLGSGPAGLTAALYAHRAGLNVFVIGGESPGGQVTMHYRVDNYPPFPGGVTGAELMMRWIKQVMEETGSMPLSDTVTAVEFSGSLKTITTEDGVYSAHAVIIATGSGPKALGVPGEEEFRGKGVFYCAMCDAPLLRTMERSRAVVIGGGDSAFHTAAALLPHAESVTVLSRRQLRAKQSLVNAFEQDPKARTVLNTSVKAIIGESMVTGLLIETSSGEAAEIPVEAVFIGAGQSPNTGFLGNNVELDQNGFVITDPLLRTSVPGVFAAGDVRTTPMRQIITAAADGAIAAQSAGEYLRTVARDQQQNI